MKSGMKPVYNRETNLQKHCSDMMAASHEWEAIFVQHNEVKVTGAKGYDKS